MRLTAGLTILVLSLSLTGCVSKGRLCPNYKNYSDEQLDKLIEEMKAAEVKEGSMIATTLDDYATLREKTIACWTGGH